VKNSGHDDMRSEPMFIAEISANHLGSLARAHLLVNAAIDAGATAVKFQTYTADTMTLNLDTDHFKISSDHELWGNRKLYELYEEAHTPWAWHKELFELCRARGVIPFSSPFDATAVDFLESLDVAMYKIASMESADIPLIKKVALTGKPLIISTGGTELEEIEDLVATVRECGNENLTLMVCTSSYPALPLDAHLSRISTLRKSFNVKVGVSDHTLGLGVSIAAIALGAVAVEKHLTLKRSDGGADGAFSMEPAEFSQLVKEGKSAFESIGDPEWSIQQSERESRRLRRSLHITQAVSKGEKVSPHNVRAIRPNGGLSPKYLEEVIGREFNEAYEIGTPLNFDQLD
jgi:pseudaminic acid synthase